MPTLQDLTPLQDAIKIVRERYGAPDLSERLILMDEHCRRIPVYHRLPGSFVARNLAEFMAPQSQDDRARPEHVYLPLHLRDRERVAQGVEVWSRAPRLPFVRKQFPRQQITGASLYVRKKDLPALANALKAATRPEDKAQDVRPKGKRGRPSLQKNLAAEAEARRLMRDEKLTKYDAAQRAARIHGANPETIRRALKPSGGRGGGNRGRN